MTDKEIQELISLKKYEQPDEGYFEDFLVEFQQRQRSEILKTSARGLLIERTKAWFSELGGVKWLVGAGVAYAAVTYLLNMDLKEPANPSSVASTVISQVRDDVSSDDTVSDVITNLRSTPESVPVSMLFGSPVDFSGPTPAFLAEERIF